MANRDTKKQVSGYAIIDGKSLFVPNSAIDGNGFYISYNDHDTSVYDCDTTALVFGQMQKFYILNGDHRSGYLPLVDKGFGACLTYFEENVGDINKYSERVAVS